MKDKSAIDSYRKIFDAIFSGVPKNSILSGNLYNELSDLLSEEQNTLFKDLSIDGTHRYCVEATWFIWRLIQDGVIKTEYQDGRSLTTFNHDYFSKRDLSALSKDNIEYLKSLGKKLASKCSV